MLIFAHILSEVTKLVEEKLSTRVSKLPLSVIRILSDSVGSSDVIKLQAGDPDFPTPEHVIKEAQKAAEEGFTHYTSNFGIKPLREAISQKLKEENGLDYNPEQICVTNGATGALSLTLLALLNEGDEILLPDPGWPNYEHMVSVAGAISIRYSLKRENGFTPDFEEIESKITQKTKAIIVNTPSNPLGAVFSKKVLEGFAEIAKRRRIYLISDEVYEKIVYDGNEHVSLGTVDDAFERTITINSLSKSYAMTGWRVGYVAGPKKIIEAVASLNSTFNACPSSIAQRAAIAALTGPQDIVKQMVAQYLKRRNFFVASLNEIPVVSATMPQGAFYVFADFSKFEKSSEKTAKFLLEKARVMGVPGNAFGPSGEGFVRFSFASSLEDLKEAAERITNALRAMSY